MTQINKAFSDLSKTPFSESNAVAVLFLRRWRQLCKTYLPVKPHENFWRFSRADKPQEPMQGWKLHISATILEACDLFERVAPFLISRDVLFKAPESLNDLSEINCGLKHGYRQVGKFITVYPSTEKEAVKLARELHELTKEFIPVSVPFDEQYLPHSSVFYRYGAFVQVRKKDENGKTVSVIKNLSGDLVAEDYYQAVPEWLSDPFRDKTKKIAETAEPSENPLMTTYKVFRAITQRGKGGTYQALDFSANPPRFCIVKEGRRYGEVFWSGQDGYNLVENEFNVLSALGKMCEGVPKVFSSFETDGNFYLAMEYVEGKNLHALMKPRRRRFSIKQIVRWAIEIAKIIAEIHQAGWIWNDCKPANLIVTPGKKLRPIDFENAYPINESALFDWKTNAYSKSANNHFSAKSDDFYAFGVVIYYLLTGRLYQLDTPIAIKKLRPKVSKQLQEIVENLLYDSSDIKLEALEIRQKLETVLDTMTASA